jgi:hypothetical protein
MKIIYRLSAIEGSAVLGSSARVKKNFYKKEKGNV